MTRELPPGWEQVQLGQICRPRTGKVIPAPDDDRPYLSLDNIASDRGAVIGWEKSSDYGSQSVELHPEDVAYARLRPYLNKVAHVDCVALGSAELIVLPKSEAILPRYLLYLLLTPSFSEFAQFESTGDRPRLKWQQMQEYEFPLPPTGEQQRIIAAVEEHFSRLDAVHGAVEAAQQKLEAFRRSSFQELFDRPDWPWTTLGQIAEVKGGVTKDSKNQSNPAYVEVPYLRVANVQRCFLDLEQITTIRVNLEKARTLRLQPGDILFNEGGDRDKLGRGWVWEGQVEDCIHQNHVFRARLTDKAFDPYFVSMHGNTWGQQWFETHGKQTTNLASLNLTTLKSFPVPSPSLSEQREVVAQLRTVMEMEDSLRADLTQAKHHIATLRQSILSDAFSGRLVPQSPHDEPASALLERIANSRQPA